MKEFSVTYTVRDRISPEILWSKYSVIQHIVFWILAIAGWHALHWLGSHAERWTLQIWLYVARIRSYFFTGDFSGQVFLGALTGLGILAIILVVDVLTARIKGERPVRHILRNYQLLPRTTRQQLIAMVVGINAGIFEELFFRGAVFVLLLNIAGSTLIAVILTSLLFAVLHTPVQGWYSTVWIFVVGIVLNILLIRTDAFYAPILCHIIINAGNLFVIPALFEEELEELLMEESGIPPTLTRE